MILYILIIFFDIGTLLAIGKSSFLQNGNFEERLQDGYLEPLFTLWGVRSGINPPSGPKKVAKVGGLG